MIPWANILEGAVLLGAGAALSHVFLWRKDRNLQQARKLEAEATVARARSEAEIIVRDARLAAADETGKMREEMEQALSARRAERMELEKRLTEREGLINSQLQRLLETEKGLSEQSAATRERAAALERKEREVAAESVQLR